MNTLLIVDDSCFMRTIIKNSIKTSNLDIKIVGEASNGEEAIEKFKTLNPDIVTLDITINKKNGIEVLKEIQEINKNSRVIMISSLGQKIMIMDSIKYGAKDFIIKPFSKDTLKNSLEKVINDSVMKK